MIFGFGGLGLMDYVDHIGFVWGLGGVRIEV